MSLLRNALAAATALALSGCIGGALTPVYPPRPPAAPGAPIADPTPARVVLHMTITEQGLAAAVEEALPKTGEGTFPFVRGERKYTYSRGAAKVSLGQGRVGIEMHVDANLDMPVSSLDVGLDFQIAAEPVITAEYTARLQSVQVAVSSTDRVVKLADAAADVLEKLRATVHDKLSGFSYDLRPLIVPAYERLARPMEIPMGDAQGCARMKLLGVEAGPTVLAGGIEKDLALVVAPQVTFPCGPDEELAPLPPLANVATLVPGPFTVTVPIAASYDELAKAMGMVFTDGKYFFSKTYPALYLSAPEVYASKDQLVLKMHIGGRVKQGSIDTALDGDLYMSGHPTVVDNELRIPDLEPTIETKSFLLGIKAALDGDTIRDQARAAMRLDIGERIRAAQDKLSTDLQFGEGRGCLKAQAHKVEVTGVHVHASYLRVYVAATASASASVPCL
ncbi:MAG: DUF4403 family protein [Polyangiaceae bacterium]